MPPPKHAHPALALALGLALGLALPALAAPTAAPACTVQVSLGGKRATAQDCDQFVAAHQQGSATWTPAPPPVTATATTAPTAPPTASPTAVPPPTVVPTSTISIPSVTPTAPVTTQSNAEQWGIPDYPEARPQNAAANGTRGRALNAALLSTTDGYQRDYLTKVDGNFTGTTEQILEWAARKWFADLVADPAYGPDILKAQAVKESYWTQDAQGDLEGGVYQSFGILQVKLKNWCAVAGCDQVKTSTAFGVDVAGAAMRAHYDGAIYTGDYASWNVFPIRADVSNPTRLRRAINAWFSGDGASHLYTDWSYNRDGAASEYVCIVLGGVVNEPGAQLHGQTLAGYLADKPWKRW